MKKFLKWLGIVIGVIVLFIITTFLPIWDRGSVDDADLVPAPVSEVSADENAYSVLGDESSRSEAELAALERASDVARRLDALDEYSLSRSSSREAESKPATFKEVEAVVRDTDALAADVLTAAEYPYYQCPAELGGPDEICELNYLRDLSDLAYVHAYYYVEIGQFDQAIDFALVPLKLGQQQITSRPARTIDYVVGLRFYKQGLTLLAYLADAHGEAVPDLTEYAIAADSYTESLQWEYVFMRDVIVDSPRFGDKNRYWVQTNRTIQDLAVYIRTMSEILSSPCDEHEKLIPLLESRDDVVENLGMSLVRQNFLGRMFLRVPTASISTVGAERCQINSRLTELSSAEQ